MTDEPDGFADMDAGARPHYLGHRQRLKARFRDRGEAALEYYELLELLLFCPLPRQNTKPIAKALLARFGSFAEMLAAPRSRLKEISGIGDTAIDDLKAVHAAALRFTRRQISERKLLNS